MPTSILKPDVVFDGQEFSGMTRFLDALHDRKDLGVDQKDVEKAQEARFALETNGPLAEESVKALVKAVKAYKKAVDDRKFGNGAAVKGEELDHLVEKLEGLESAAETEDENGKKVHPAALPPGDTHEDDGKGNQPLPKPGNDVPKLKAEEDKKDEPKKDLPKK